MKLTEKQKEVIFILKEEKSISKDRCRIHTNVMSSLYFKGLITLTRCANGEFWNLTDEGINLVL